VTALAHALQRGCLRASLESSMTMLHKEVVIAAPCELVWDAIRDIGALHTRLVPGFVVDTKLDGDPRIVTFGKLPHDLSGTVAEMQEQALPVMTTTLEAAARH
jgi:hypothetical protein